MSSRNDTGWEERADGWHKTGHGANRMTNDVFSRPEPIIRDSAGRPMAADRVSIDIARWVKEVNEREGGQR